MKLWKSREGKERSDPEMQNCGKIKKQDLTPFDSFTAMTCYVPIISFSPSIT